MRAEGAGLFLDLDGTLADSLGVMRAVYDRFLGHYGKTGSDAEFARLNGPPLPRIVAELACAHGLCRPHGELMDLYRALIAEAYRGVMPNAGARDLLRAAREAGLRAGVVTSNSVDLAASWLRTVDLANRVDCVVGGNEVSKGKPNPAPYLLALARTGCAAARSLAVEDSATGARAAEAAGLRTFVMSTGQHRKGLSGINRSICSVTRVDGVVPFTVELGSGDVDRVELLI